ncbi:unnamed protein product [Cylicocyclus nassatus]|uniref:Uncharacterized protein n=1 Tax=Cylicocyclus nassatus TaxID=53992 RepID=A0AA36DQB7_CYLNA|nr:unnamed protein product [Cylicocyclus nassatus]
MAWILDTVEFVLTFSLCASQLVFSVLRSISSSVNPTIADSHSFEEFMCSFWFLALCGCLTRRRYIIVFTTMAMFYSFVLSLKWATEAQYSYLNGTQLSCTRIQRHTDPTWCRNADIFLVVSGIIAILATLAAAVLSSLRLWSEEEDNEEKSETLLPHPNDSRKKQSMISAFRSTIN